MKERPESAARLEEILDENIAIMTELHGCQRRMHECVIDRDWVALQKETALRDLLGERIGVLETERRRVMEAFSPQVGNVTDFYRATASIEPIARASINAKYRELKRLVLLSKTENDVFDTYLCHAQSLLKGLIEAVVPARRNKTYTKNGALNAGPVESLVLNRSF